MAGLDVNVVATLGFSLRDENDGDGDGGRGGHPARGEDDGRVVYVPFAPMDQLPDGTDAVVGAGGSGTVLAALTGGVPLVLRPQGADQPVNAARASAAGAAITVDDADAIPSALAAVLTDDSYRDAPRDVAAHIAKLPDAEQTVHDLTA